MEFFTQGLQNIRCITITLEDEDTKLMLNGKVIARITSHWAFGNRRYFIEHADSEIDTGLLANKDNIKTATTAMLSEFGLKREDLG